MIRIENYTINTSHIIGKGSWSKVYEGINNTTQNNVAVKIIDKQKIKPAILDKLTKEIEILKMCSHPNILTLDGVIYDSKYVYIITDLCAGTIYDITKRRKVPEEETLYYVSQLKDGLKYLFENNIVHRDLKPQNLLITYKHNAAHGDYTNIQLKIADFGLAKIFDTEKDLFETICGSPYFISNEVFEGKGNVKSDLWSIGILIYQMLFNRLPYKPCKNIQEILAQIRNIEIPSKDISLECLDILKKLLIIDVDSRIGWNEFFTHEWFDTLHYMENSFDESMINSIRKEAEKNKETDDSSTYYDYMKKTIVLDNYVDRKMSETIDIRIPVCKPTITFRNNSAPSPLINGMNTFYRLMTSSINSLTDSISRNK